MFGAFIENIIYYVSFVDVCSYTWIYLIKTKNEVFPAFIQFKKYMKKLLNLSILRVQTVVFRYFTF